MKKTVQVIAAMFVFLCITALSPQVSNAYTWAKVTVNKMGPTADYNGCGYFSHDHTSPVFTNQWFKFEASLSNQMIATALTAITLEKTLQIRIQDDGKTIDRMYLINE